MIVRNLQYPRGMTARGLWLVLIALLAWPLAALAADQHGRPDLAQGKLDLNTASLAEIQQLPIPADVAEAIYNYRAFVRFFDDLFDLNEVPEVTPEIINVLKPLVATLPPPELDAAFARMAASYRSVRNYLGQEGSNEGLVDEYLDLLQDPVNINDLDMFDLMSFQNVSPVDAANILKARQRLGSINTARQLRRADGLRYFAYRNLRDFVVYRDDQLDDPDQVRADYQMRYQDSPLYDGEDENSAIVMYQQFALLETPTMSHKLRLALPGDWRAGFRSSRRLGEESWNETAKGFVEVKDQQLGPFHLKRAVAGNFRAAFGSGLVMDNTDFIHFRKTGYGWNKRPLGIRGDLSRTRQYRLTGGAVEGRAGNTHLTMFASSDWRDAIMNEDGTVNRYVSLNPRFEDSYLYSDQYWIDQGRYGQPDHPDSTAITRNAFRENLVGVNVKQILAPGTYLGATVLHSGYNRAFDANPGTLLDGGTGSDYWMARDSEIAAAYTSTFSDGENVTEYKWRRIYGLEGQTVVGNTSLQAEYAWLQDPREGFLKGDHHDAFIANLFSQWDNLHLLAIYRDYDIGFDNPYMRSFSNDARYEQTILDSPYRMRDDWYSLLSSDNPQPKGERGLFLDMRYRISRHFIINGLQFDQWERKADGTDQWRATAKLEYQPKFNLRFRLRHRVSSRSEANDLDVRTYKSWEDRLQMIMMLSNYNRLDVMFMTGNVNFPARQRLGGPAETGDFDSGVGQASDVSRAFQVMYTHNVTPWLRFMAATSLYDGFFWNFEGNEFVLLQGDGWRKWFKVESRISDRMLVQLKVTHDHKQPLTDVDVRRYNEAFGEDFDATYVPRDDLFVRFQVDYSF